MSAHWRRRRRAVLRPDHREPAETTAWSLALLLVTGALLMVTTGLMAIAHLEQFGPPVGSIITFRRDMLMSERWAVNAAIVPAAHVGLPSERTPSCRLSPAMLAGHGGSLVVEARRLSRPPAYRVHWAGGPTDAGANDCGTEADLVLERTELMRLANVAGGFNAGLKLIGP